MPIGTRTHLIQNPHADTSHLGDVNWVPLQPIGHLHRLTTTQRIQRRAQCIGATTGKQSAQSKYQDIVQSRGQCFFDIQEDSSQARGDIGRIAL